MELETKEIQIHFLRDIQQKNFIRYLILWEVKQFIIMQITDWYLVEC